MVTGTLVTEWISALASCAAAGAGLYTAWGTAYKKNLQILH